MIQSLNRGIPLSTLAAALLALFALDNILLLAFLGLSPLFMILLILLLCPMMAAMAGRTIKSDIVVPWRAIVIAGLVALALFVLGGQGRFFYANPDWQVRDALLADMARYSWPFAYQLESGEAILRAPIGLYLLPSLAGGGWHELAMLASNSLRLTLLLALSWPLFANGRHRTIALTIFLLFSGMDLVGTVIFDWLGVQNSWDHLERWNFNNQFSSHITQAFWVPQHAMAGWACAVGFLLWHNGLARIGLLAAVIPMVAIWSPLAIMGAIPFALLAGIMVLKNRDWSLRDVTLALLGLAIALPALGYMQADAAKLGTGARAIGMLPYVLLIALEVLPFTIPLLLARSAASKSRLVLWTILTCLLALPLFQIGTNSDFQMRASIMPLALLAYFFGTWVSQLSDSGTSSRGASICAALLLAIGAATPFMEARRALIHPPSPTPLCSLAGVWDNQQGLQIAPYATYFARVEALTQWTGQIAVKAGLNDPQKCWDRDWD